MSVRLPREVQGYRTRSGECPFRSWYWSLDDRSLQLAVDARIDRLALGNAGDCKAVGEGVFELRIHHRAGYRVYFAYDGETIILLLTGGEKSTQRADIRDAKRYLADYRERKKGRR
jgi:putative addiction module killer protein